MKKVKPQGIDALVIPAITDLKECWYGIEIDKNKFHIEIEDLDENISYLKIVHNKSYQERVKELEEK
jgi:hypothetical protein